MLRQSTIETIKTITPAVAANAETITRRFYELMFAGNPEVKQYFNEAHQHSGGQQKALAGAICAYFSQIDDLESLTPAVEIIAQKHCSLGIEPEHYPIVGKHLLSAIKEVMGDAATEPVLGAVAEAYGVLADVCINREKAIYSEQLSQPGGWNGYRPFVVAKKVPESRVVTSFYLKPGDDRPLPAFQPGQYVTVRMNGLKTSPRNYSLSDSPGKDYFRISVKREPGVGPDDPVGMVSNYLHDQVNEGDRLEVGPPCGEFTLRSPLEEKKAVVFLSGGIGVTPLIAMAKHLVREMPEAPVYFFQASRNSEAHAFSEEVAQLGRESKQFQSLVMFDKPLPGDLESGKCDGVGTLSEELLREWLPSADAQIYFCGPAPFMKSAYRMLGKIGVPRENLHFEFFGPRQEIESSIHG
ncbi:MAG: NO-inducible flavohemoprotein [Bdellovibrionota bacterium]